MKDQKIVDYIVSQMKEGVSLEEIRKELDRRNLTENEIKDYVEAAIDVAIYKTQGGGVTEDEERPKKQWGFILSLIGSVIIFVESLVLVLYPLPVLNELHNILNFIDTGIDYAYTLALGFGILIISFGVKKSRKKKILGILIVVLSLIAMVISGFILGPLLGIIGGVLISRKSAFAR